MNESERIRLFEIGRKRFEQLRPDLLKNHRGDMLFIDCRTGDYEVQQHSETRFETQGRFLKTHPDAFVYVDRIEAEDFAYHLPAMSAN